MMAALLVALIVFLLAVETPIAFAVGVVAVAGLLLTGLGNAPIAAQRMFSGMNSYGLLALPLFILAGNLLVAGGIIHRMVAFADLVVGKIRGGLAYVNVVSNLMMAGISGSATADTAALGAVMVPMMRARGYSTDFAAALTVSGAIMGPIIPPSLVMVIYAIPTKLSIGAMFFAGILPGLLIAGLLAAYVFFACRRMPLPPPPDREGRSFLRSTLDAVPVLVAPVIIVGGVRGGIFTATEAAAVLVAYALALVLVLYRSIGPAELFAVFRESALTTATVMIVVATSSLFAWFLAIENVPNATRDLFQAVTDNRYVFLVIVNIFLLVVGSLVDTVPAILIFVPILQPTAVEFGIDPIHFAIVVIVNLMIGLNTPPIGTNLFVISSITGRRVGSIARALLPFYAVKIVGAPPHHLRSLPLALAAPRGRNALLGRDRHAATDSERRPLSGRPVRRPARRGGRGPRRRLRGLAVPVAGPRRRPVRHRREGVRRGVLPRGDDRRSRARPAAASPRRRAGRRRLRQHRRRRARRGAASRSATRPTTARWTSPTTRSPSR